MTDEYDVYNDETEDAEETEQQAPPQAATLEAPTATSELTSALQSALKARGMGKLTPENSEKLSGMLYTRLNAGGNATFRARVDSAVGDLANHLYRQNQMADMTRMEQRTGATHGAADWLKVGFSKAPEAEKEKPLDPNQPADLLAAGINHPDWTLTHPNAPAGEDPDDISGITSPAELFRIAFSKPREQKK